MFKNLDKFKREKRIRNKKSDKSKHIAKNKKIKKVGFEDKKLKKYKDFYIREDDDYNV